MKQCCKCNKIKDSKEFYKNKSTDDGLSHACKSCTYTKKLPQTLKDKFESCVIKQDGCWDWDGSITSGGYTEVFWKGKHLVGSRVSYELHIGPIPEGKIVCHTCDNRKCTNPDHLFVGSNKDNSTDMVKKKRHIHGEKAYNAKLTNEDVINIRAEYQKGVRGKGYRSLAVKYGVSDITIYDIIRGKYWRHVDVGA